jgi:hypothetical protein
MGGACSTYGEEKSAYRVLVGNLKEKDHFEDLGVDGRVILNCIFKNWDGGSIHWIDLGLDRDR